MSSQHAWHRPHLYLERTATRSPTSTPQRRCRLRPNGLYHAQRLVSLDYRKGKVVVSVVAFVVGAADPRRLDAHQGIVFTHVGDVHFPHVDGPGAGDYRGQSLARHSASSESPVTQQGPGLGPCGARAGLRGRKAQCSSWPLPDSCPRTSPFRTSPMAGSWSVCA